MSFEVGPNADLYREFSPTFGWQMVLRVARSFGWARMSVTDELAARFPKMSAEAIAQYIKLELDSLAVDGRENGWTEDQVEEMMKAMEWPAVMLVQYAPRYIGKEEI